MKHILFITFFLIFSFTTASAQQAPAAASTVEKSSELPKDVKTKLFQVQYRDTIQIANILRSLGSRFVLVDPNREFKTIVVRDLPENLVMMEETLKRLDVPIENVETYEVQVHLLTASKQKVVANYPQSLTNVVKQLEKTLKYEGYEYATTITSRINSGRKLEAQGSLDTFFTSSNGTESANYLLTIEQVSSIQSPQNEVNLSRFNMSVYNRKAEQAKISTDITLREGEMVVVGTSSLGDRGLIVVVSVKKM